MEKLRKTRAKSNRQEPTIRTYSNMEQVDGILEPTLQALTANPSKTRRLRMIPSTALIGSQDR